MADTIPPTLVGLTISSHNIDLSNGPVQITFTGTGTDNAGISDLSISFAANGGFNFLGGTPSINGFPDSWADGQSAQNYTVPVYTHNGTYTISGVTLFDVSGNQKSYTTAQLTALGINTTVTVTGGDNTGPTLTALNLPNSVAAGHNLTISASATDRSGIASVSIDFDKNLVSGGSSFNIFGTTDSWADGTSASTSMVPAGTPNGTYTIHDVRLTDSVGNTTTLTTSQLAAAGFHTTITVSDADTTPPVLTALTFPGTIDLSTGDKVATFQASATDDASGILDVIVHFDRDFSSGTNGAGLIDITGGNGDSWADGSSHVDDSISHAVPSSGVYNITSVEVKDGAGNTATYTPSQLAAKGIATSLTVIPGHQNPVDTTPPTLQNITFPKGVDVSQDDSFPLTVHATDDSSGVASVTVWLDNPIDLLPNGVSAGFLLNGSNDSWSNGASSGTWFFSSDATSGVYAIDHIDVSDVVGNTRTYSAIDLAALGMPWGFFVYDSSFAVSSSNVIGGTGDNDILQGSQSSSIIFGGDGNDQLICTGGHDWLYGGKGDDIYVVVSIFDLVFEFANQGTDLVETSLNSYTLTDFVENLIFSGSGDFNGQGNNLSNDIIGGAGSDVIQGGFGNDWLQGGSAGFDILIGGNGFDNFAFDAQYQGITDIRDFDQGNQLLFTVSEDDLIDLSAFSLSTLVRLYADSNNAHLLLQVNSTGFWLTIAEIDNVQFSHQIAVTFDNSQTEVFYSVFSDNGHFGDFDGDGRADLVWRNDNGVVATWQMNGGSVSHGNFLMGVSSDWHIVGTGDFNGDGRADILWLNDNGALIDWQSANSTSTATIGTRPANTVLSGIGDVDHDGKSDLIWRDATNGAVTIDLANGTINTITGTGNEWQVVGVGDYNGDGMADIMFRNASQGVNAAWLMNGANFSNVVFYPGVPNDWHVVGTGDFDGNGTADLLWHNDSGGNAVWLMKADGSILTAGFFDGVSSDWHVVGTGDFDGRTSNSHPIDDVVWRNDAGATAIWLMNGTQIPSVSFPGGVPDDWATQAHHYDYV